MAVYDVPDSCQHTISAFLASKRAFWSHDSSQSGKMKASIWKSSKEVLLLWSAVRQGVAVQNAVAGRIILIDKPQPSRQPCLYDESTLLEDALRSDIGGVNECTDTINAGLGSKQFHEFAGGFCGITLIPLAGGDNVSELKFAVLVECTDAADKTMGIFQAN